MARRIRCLTRHRTPNRERHLGIEKHPLEKDCLWLTKRNCGSRMVKAACFLRLRAGGSARDLARSLTYCRKS